ncbi:MAG: type IV secretion system protein VirB9, partial [Alphaproteobacteria bacterium]
MTATPMTVSGMTPAGATGRAPSQRIARPATRRRARFISAARAFAAMLVIAVPVLGPIAISAARADTAPRPGAADPRVRTVAYRANDVVAIEGRYGFLTMIELSEDERIENVAIGDSLAWQVVPSRSAHMLFLKPVEQNASTNLAVVTNRRIYAFALSARNPASSRSGAPTRDGVYRVIFSYPEEEARRAGIAAARARMEAIARDREATAIAAAATSPTDWNVDYRQ